MRPLTFKETMASDVHGVFLNPEEFADRHTIKYDGKVYENIPVSLQDAEQTERQQRKDDHLPGIFRVKSVLYCALEDIGGKLPEQGGWLEINDGKNPKFFNKYQVGGSGVEPGGVPPLARRVAGQRTRPTQDITISRAGAEVGLMRMGPGLEDS